MVTLCKVLDKQRLYPNKVVVLRKSLPSLFLSSTVGLGITRLFGPVHSSVHTATCNYMYWPNYRNIMQAQAILCHKNFNKQNRQSELSMPLQIHSIMTLHLMHAVKETWPYTFP